MSLVLMITCVAVFWQSVRGKQGSPIRNVSRVYRVRNAPTLPPSVNGPVVHIRMTGTPGMPFEVSHSENGNDQITPGVLPGEVSFAADAFSARITALGAGDLGFEIYRDDFRLANASASSVTNGYSWLVAAKKGGVGLSVRH